jgi:hypothetical protein
MDFSIKRKQVEKIPEYSKATFSYLYKKLLQPKTSQMRQFCSLRMSMQDVKRDLKDRLEKDIPVLEKETTKGDHSKIAIIIISLEIMIFSFNQNIVETEFSQWQQIWFDLRSKIDWASVEEGTEKIALSRCLLPVKADAITRPAIDAQDEAKSFEKESLTPQQILRISKRAYKIVQKREMNLRTKMLNAKLDIIIAILQMEICTISESEKYAESLPNDWSKISQQYFDRFHGKLILGSQ